MPVKSALSIPIRQQLSASHRSLSEARSALIDVNCANESLFKIYGQAGHPTPPPRQQNPAVQALSLMGKRRWMPRLLPASTQGLRPPRGSDLIDKRVCRLRARSRTSGQRQQLKQADPVVSSTPCGGDGSANRKPKPHPKPCAQLRSRRCSCEAPRSRSGI